MPPDFARGAVIPATRLELLPLRRCVVVAPSFGFGLGLIDRLPLLPFFAIVGAPSLGGLALTFALARLLGAKATLGLARVGLRLTLVLRGARTKASLRLGLTRLRRPASREQRTRLLLVADALLISLVEDLLARLQHDRLARGARHRGGAGHRRIALLVTTLLVLGLLTLAHLDDVVVLLHPDGRLGHGFCSSRGLSEKARRDFPRRDWRSARGRDVLDDLGTQAAVDHGG